jgi:hypothetical protein
MSRFVQAKVAGCGEDRCVHEEPEVNSPPFQHFHRWLVAWAKIADGLVGVLSGGYWCPDWAYSLALWAEDREYEAWERAEYPY